MSQTTPQTLTIVRPDDWHVHLRDGATLAAVIADTARQFQRAIIMPNLQPPVTTGEQALEYRERILDAVSAAGLPDDAFTPLMTLYLTDNTSADEIRTSHATGVIHAVKLYPAGATTNSDAGVTDLLRHCSDVLETMQDIGMPLLVHGEVT